MDITEDLEEIKILEEYLNMRQKCTNNLCELLFLQDFPQTGNVSSHIIKYMFNRYMNITSLINEHPNALIAFTFTYRTEDVHIHEITLSNHMQFRSDIIMICYIQHLLIFYKHLNKKYKVIKAMMILMINKYNIDAFAHPESNTITFMNISASFLSIYFDILHNNFANFSDISHLFPDFSDFNLPVMIYAPFIISILPMLNDPPFAILIVIALLMYETSHTTSNISLIALYTRIITFYYNSTIPTKMKLFLCRRYNIVVLEGDKFKFAPSFAQYRQKAKDIISQKRSNDPNLELILSMI